VTVIALPPKNVHEMTRSEGHHDGKPEAENTVKQRDVMAGPDVPKIHEDDAQAVESVENDDRNERYFSNPHQWRLVSADDGVVSLGANPDERGVQYVHEEKKVDTHTGDAV
jgi:hypothetical protein